MFGIGLVEIAFIFFVVIIFVKPQDLPSFLRKIGRLFGQARRAYGAVVAEVKEFESIVNIPEHTISRNNDLEKKGGSERVDRPEFRNKVD